jgi:hypothetical protein
VSHFGRWNIYSRSTHNDIEVEVAHNKRYDGYRWCVYKRIMGGRELIKFGFSRTKQMAMEDSKEWVKNN